LFLFRLHRRPIARIPVFNPALGEKCPRRRKIMAQLRTITKTSCQPSGVVGFCLIRQPSPVLIVCVPVIEQASSDAFNGRNQTISFDRVPFPLASRNSPDFAFNLSGTRLQINRMSPTIRVLGQWPGSSRN